MALREFVHRQHSEDMNSALNYIRNEWPTPEPSSDLLDNASIVCWAVSTTDLSTVLILSIGVDSKFTGTTTSTIEEKPWLIIQGHFENKLLSRHISKKWRTKTIDQGGDPDLVDQIAKHVVYKYDRVQNEWLLLPIAADESNTIRFETDDFIMWSHPPRDEPLKRVLEGMKDSEGGVFNQVKGDMGRFFNDLVSIRRNTLMPDVRKLNAEAVKLTVIGLNFSKLYKFYEILQTKSRVPTSYMWPTLQLSVKYNEVQEQRFGNTIAGVYKRNENEVHHIFPALNVVARDLPSKEEVFKSLLPEDLNLTLHDIEMADQNQG